MRVESRTNNNNNKFLSGPTIKSDNENWQPKPQSILRNTNRPKSSMICSLFISIYMNISLNDVAHALLSTQTVRYGYKWRHCVTLERVTLFLSILCSPTISLSLSLCVSLCQLLARVEFVCLLLRRLKVCFGYFLHVFFFGFSLAASLLLSFKC